MLSPPCQTASSFLLSHRGGIFTLSLSVKSYLYLLKLNMFKVNLFFFFFKVAYLIYLNRFVLFWVTKT